MYSENSELTSVYQARLSGSSCSHGEHTPGGRSDDRENIFPVVRNDSNQGTLIRIIRNIAIYKMTEAVWRTAYICGVVNCIYF